MRSTGLLTAAEVTTFSLNDGCKPTRHTTSTYIQQHSIALNDLIWQTSSDFWWTQKTGSLSPDRIQITKCYVVINLFVNIR